MEVDAKLTKTQHLRLKKKLRKQKKQASKQKQTKNGTKDVSQTNVTGKPEHELDVEIEYVAAPIFQNEEESSQFQGMKEVLEKFTLRGKEEVVAPKEEERKVEVKEEKLSKKKRKMQRRLPIAVLKQLVDRPDLVEIHDTCGADPFLLMYLKASRNTVPVPRHWSQKRKYLQGKRGIEKAPFELPAFIKATGISEVRNATLEKEAEKKLKQKARERLNPSLGKIDIDYQVLHDAFFRHQTKPSLTLFGDVYYEGKEYEVEMLSKRPGLISDKLREALGMSSTSPPPWLHNMQRVGLPPSYQQLRIPGLNAPRPLGTEYGYHPGGWGRPPVDEYGNPLYPEAFSEPTDFKTYGPKLLEGTHWGALAREEFESESDEEEEGRERKDEEEEEAEEEGVVPLPPPPGEEDFSGIETPLGGMETPSNIEATLRKKKKSDKDLYTVLEEKEVSVGTTELYGSSHLYVLPKEKKDKVPKPPPGAPERVELMKSQKSESIELSLDPSELPTLTEDVLEKKYDKEIADRKKDREKLTDDGGRKRKRIGSTATKQKKKKKAEFKF
eukprot:TRINITY_DN4359_c0_g2_i1.p1 TRINITY_DN4359_c0_g2~~TRINITY_DN4359_c0_g2_i1.p1  ORF type:complete len:555 (+),score=164.23 TRINITY_DN4359_c0_g2_i1:255-1919(+)